MGSEMCIRDRCKAKIEKGTLRIGTISPGPGDYDVTQWRHLACQKKPKNLGEVQNLEHFDVIDPSDQEKVRSHFATGGGSPAKRSRAEIETDKELKPKKMKAAELKKTLEVCAFYAWTTHSSTITLAMSFFCFPQQAHGGATSGSTAKLRAGVEEIKQRAELEMKYGQLAIPALKVSMLVDQEDYIYE